MTISVYPDHKDKHFAIAYTALLNLHKIGFKLIPLAEDAKTPNVTGLLTAEEEKISIKESNDGKPHPVTHIYNHPDFWNEERIKKEGWRFHNVATTLGRTHLKEDGNAVFLECLDIDSQNVYDKLFNLQNPSSKKKEFFSNYSTSDIRDKKRSRNMDIICFGLATTPTPLLELLTANLVMNMKSRQTILVALSHFHRQYTEMIRIFITHLLEKIKLNYVMDYMIALKDY